MAFPWESNWDDEVDGGEEYFNSLDKKSGSIYSKPGVYIDCRSFSEAWRFQPGTLEYDLEIEKCRNELNLSRRFSP